MASTDVLRALPIFQGLSEAQLEGVSAVLVRRKVEAREMIFREGDRSTSMYVLVSGSVGTSKRLGLAARTPNAPAREKMLVHLAAPQFFGEMGLLSDVERSASITTETECELLELRREDFERMTTDDPLLGYRLMRNVAVVIAERLRRTDVDVMKLTTALSLALGNR